MVDMVETFIQLTMQFCSSLHAAIADPRWPKYNILIKQLTKLGHKTGDPR